MSKIKIFHNWITSMPHKNRPFGINDGSHITYVDTRIPKEHRDWAITHGGFDKLSYKGNGERVGVLDTGVDARHIDLIGQVEGYSFLPYDNSSRDEHGHGSFTTGQIVAKENGKGVVGIAHNATAFHGRVLYGNWKDSSLSAFEKSLANGIIAAANNGCGAISMSLGTSHSSPVVKDALAYAVERGCIPFAAAGNEALEGSKYRSYPASFEDCISVGAANEKDMPHWFTTEGRGGEIWQQPEIAIASLEYYWGCAPGDAYTKQIGTSMAAPIMTGVCLLWRQALREQNKLPTGRDAINEFRKWIQRVANDTNQNGWDPEIGWGVLLLEDGEL